MPAGRPLPDSAEPVARGAARSADERFVVICLCAQWCGTCRDYRAGFESLAAAFDGVEFRWLDIEDEAEALGDIDVENFPTIFVRRGDSVLFFGTLLPHLNTLRRLIETFVEQTPQQSRAYARSSPERLAWQADPDLCRLGSRD
jgi:thioredoxin 1